MTTSCITDKTIDLDCQSLWFLLSIVTEIDLIMILLSGNQCMPLEEEILHIFHEFSLAIAQ